MDTEISALMKSTLHQACYHTNNNYAYFYDLNQSGPSVFSKRRLEQEEKYTNFVPTYDHWCLYCNNKSAKKRCGQCKAVYFCNQKCQKLAWKIHQKHCGQNLFQYCATCGRSELKYSLKCEKCPVRFCSQTCYNILIKPHLEIDCQTMQRFN